MRIISGIYKGKRLYPPKNIKARPTTDFAKESLFNILLNHFYIEDTEVLDLFSGTGSIAYEFASRGARTVTAVEKDQDHIKYIHKIVSDLALDSVQVIRGDVFSYLKKPYQSFDIIFADPPFDLTGLDQLPLLVLESGMLADGGWFILEHPSRYSFSALSGFYQHRKYGSVNFTIFKKS